MANLANSFFYTTVPPAGKTSAAHFRQAPPALDDNGLPVPPPAVLQYGGEKIEGHLASGKRDAELLFALMAKVGHAWGNTLEFGCGNARVLRWFAPMAREREIWGVDPDAARIMWCMAHLRPLHFCASFTAPHLPFEDRFFTFAYAYSIFTHLDESFAAWIQELRRVLAPGGYLFVTIHDEQAAIVGRERPGALKEQASAPGYKFNQESCTFDIYRAQSGVLFTCIKRDFFLSQAVGFDLIEVVPNTMAGFQTGLLLRRNR